MEKHAVDSTAQDYWESYFGPYGRQWVRTIPRRVAMALLTRQAKAAAATAAGAAPGAAHDPVTDSSATVRQAEAIAAHVVPLMDAPVVTRDRIHLEGAVMLPDGQHRLFSASFSHGGRLLGFEAF